MQVSSSTAPKGPYFVGECASPNSQLNAGVMRQLLAETAAIQTLVTLKPSVPRELQNCFEKMKLHCANELVAKKALAYIFETSPNKNTLALWHGYFVNKNVVWPNPYLNYTEELERLFVSIEKVTDKAFKKFLNSIPASTNLNKNQIDSETDLKEDQESPDFEKSVERAFRLLRQPNIDKTSTLRSLCRRHLYRKIEECNRVEKECGDSENEKTKASVQIAKEWSAQIRKEAMAYIEEKEPELSVIKFDVFAKQFIKKQTDPEKRLKLVEKAKEHFNADNANYLIPWLEEKEFFNDPNLAKSLLNYPAYFNHLNVDAFFKNRPFFTTSSDEEHFKEVSIEYEWFIDCFSDPIEKQWIKKEEITNLFLERAMLLLKKKIREDDYYDNQICYDVVHLWQWILDHDDTSLDNSKKATEWLKDVLERMEYKRHTCALITRFSNQFKESTKRLIQDILPTDALNAPVWDSKL